MDLLQVFLCSKSNNNTARKAFYVSRDWWKLLQSDSIDSSVARVIRINLRLNLAATSLRQVVSRYPLN